MIAKWIRTLPAPRRLAAAWHDFFHAPVDLRVCGLIRICYAALVLIWMANLFPNLHRWYGEAGVLPYAASREFATKYDFSFFRWWPASDAALWAAFGLLTLHAVCLLVGLGSRVNSLLVFLWLLSFQSRNPLILDGEDTVFRVVNFYLIWMPSGACYSLDRWIQGRLWGRTPPTSGPAWGLRLLQLQMALIFFSAALCKIQGSAWRDGTALYYVSRLDDVWGKFPTPRFLWQTPWIVRLLTWASLATEFFTPLLIWIPRLRWPVLIVIVLFHLGMDYTMHLLLFHWIMLAGWLSFVRGEDLDWLRGRGRSA